MPNSSGAEESDQQREAEAYNNSIYLMAGTPYLCLVVVGFLVYRAFRRKHLAEQAALRRQEGTAAPANAFRPVADGGPPLLS